VKCEQCKKEKETAREIKLRIPNNCYGKIIKKNLCDDCRRELWELIA